MGTRIEINRLLAACLAAVVLLSGCAQTPLENQGSPSSDVKELPIPPEYKDVVQREFVLGKLIKTYDDVAWIGTDAVIASGFKPQDPKAAAYVVEPTTDDLDGKYQFAFIEEIGGKLRVTAIAQVDHHAPGMGKVVGARVMEPAPDASYEDSQMYSALKAAENAPGLQFCNAIYNHVVMPYQEDGKFEYLVYFLMSTKIKGQVPIGGHVLVRVAGDAKTILEVKPLSKSCNMQEGADDPRAVALAFTNLALDSPSAVQVFLMYRYEKPVYMGTKNRFLWVIDSRGIRLLATDAGKK